MTTILCPACYPYSKVELIDGKCPRERCGYELKTDPTKVEHYSTYVAERHVDNRHSKSYYRDCGISFRSENPLLASVSDLADNLPAPLFLDLKARFDFHQTPSRATADVPIYTTVSFSFTLSAPRPSEIISVEDATTWAKTIARPYFEKRIEAELAKEVACYDRNKLVDKLARQAGRLIDHATDAADKEARAITRYAQKRAALDAELAAELKIQHKAQLDKLADLVVSHNESRPDDPFDPRAVEIAKRQAERFAPVVDSGFLPQERASNSIQRAHVDEVLDANEEKGAA